MGTPATRLIAIAFDDEYKADEARVALRRMEGDGLIDIAESATVVMTPDRKLRLSQDLDLTQQRKMQGHWLGIAAAVVTGVQPLILAGTAAGAVIGKLTDHGITDKALKQIGQKLAPCTSALFVLINAAPHADLVVERLRPFGGQVIHTTLSPEAERDLARAFEGASAAGGT